MPWFGRGGHMNSVATGAGGSSSGGSPGVNGMVGGGTENQYCMYDNRFSLLILPGNLL